MASITFLLGSAGLEMKGQGVAVERREFGALTRRWLIWGLECSAMEFKCDRFIVGVLLKV